MRYLGFPTPLCCKWVYIRQSETHVALIGRVFHKGWGRRIHLYLAWSLGYTVVFNRSQFSLQLFRSSCTTMAPPDMSDGLQIAQPETYPEAVHRYSTNNDTKLPQLHDQSHHQTPGRRSHERVSFGPGPRSVQSDFGPNVEVPVDLWKKVFLHRRRNFWYTVILSVVIVGALIGGLIGAALFVQNKTDEYVSRMLFVLTFIPNVKIQIHRCRRLLSGCRRKSIRTTDLHIHIFQRFNNKSIRW
jgi:hypothetical protein